MPSLSSSSGARRAGTAATAVIAAIAASVAILGGVRPVSAGSGVWTAAGPEGAAVRVIAVSRVTGTVYVGTADGGVFKSRDGGTTWLPARRGLPSAVVYRFALVPGQPDILYAATLAGFFKSSDGAAHWSPIGLTDPIYDVEVAPGDPRIVYVSTYNQLLRSDDSGAHWSVFGGKAAPLGVSFLAVDPRDPGTVVTGGQLGIQRTIDGGATWQTLLRTRTGRVTLDPFDPQMLYALTLYGLQTSADGGATWSNAESEPASFSSFVVDPSTPGILYASSHGNGEGIYRSADHGANWSSLYHDQGVNSLAVDPRDPSRLYAGLDETGMLASRDGGAHWDETRRGLVATQVPELLPASDGTLYAVARTHPFSISIERLLVRRAGGAGWEARAGFAGLSLAKTLLDPSAPGTLYLGFANGILVRSTDGGRSFGLADAGLPHAEDVEDLALSPAAPATLYTITRRAPANTPDLCPTCPAHIFRSDDGGASWTALALPAGSGPRAVAVDPVKPATVYLAGAKLFRSDNRGATWRPIGRGVAGPWHRLLIDPRRHDTLYGVTAAAKGPRVWKSTDGGATWTAAATGLPGGADVRTLVFDPRSSSTLYAATAAGVFVTETGGRRWTALNDGLLDLSVLSITVDPDDPQTLYAGTTGLGGLFVLTRE